MKTKYKIINSIKVMTILVLLTSLSFCLASENNKSYEDVSNSLEYMRQNIKYIDEKIYSIKKTQAYNKYPAVRLNIETPLFGINSIMKNKLLIKENVATTDIISGYSVYDIVRTNKVKVPSLSVGSVIVSTREVSFDEDVTLSDVNSSLDTIVNAMKISNDAKKFIDDYVNKTLNEYIEEDKKAKIKNLKEENNKLKETLSKSQDDLIILKILNSEKYADILKEYKDIYNIIYANDNKMNDILITDDSIKAIEASFTDLQNRISLLNENITSLKSSLNTDIEYVLRRFEYENNEIINEVSSYLGNSYDILKIEDLKASTDKIISENSLDDENYKMVIYYIVSSEDILSSMQLTLNKQYEQLEIYRSKNKTYEYGSQEYDNLVSTFIDIYKELVSKHNDFLAINYDSLLSDSASKVSSIVDYTDEYISNDYIYINFYAEYDINNLNNKYKTESYFDILNKLDYYKGNINSLITRYQNINNIYNNLTKLGKIS